MRYNFDSIIDRKGSNCEKYDHAALVFGTDDVIPLWVADMDFASGDFIIDAIERRAGHSVFGYTYRSEGYNRSIVGWFARRNGWEIDPAWLDFSPGVVVGVTMAMLAVTDESDGVVIQPPVYHPFARAVKFNNRKLLTNPLVYDPEKGYSIDFDDLDAKLSGAKAFILCNPHNPTGRSFSREELLRIGELCLRHGVKIISDEIHCDFVYPPGKFNHVISLSPEIAGITMTFVAPSKSFNVAGLCTSAAVIPDPALRRLYHDRMMRLHMDGGNIFGMVALEAAYTHGDRWMDELIGYLQGNIDFVLDFLARNIPSVKCVRPEATYLMWLDFSEWGLPQSELNRFLIEEARIGLSDGTIFGEEGAGFQRMNIGSPRKVIARAMEQLLKAQPKAV